LKHLTHFCLILLCSTRLLASGEPFPIGARSWAMANTLVAVSHPQSFFNNPAGLGFMKGSYLSTSYFSRFEISGLGYYGAAGSFEFSEFNFGVGAEKFGDKLYHESKLGLAIAKNTGRVSLGLKFNYLNSGVAQISSRSGFLAEFGVMAKVHPKVSMGFHAYNITSAKLYESQKIPVLLSLGFAFLVSEKVFVTTQSDYYVGLKPTFRAGLQYEFYRNFFAAAGVNPQMKAFHFGLGWQYRKFSFDYAASTDMYFGMSNQFTLSMTLKSPQKENEKNLYTQ